VVQRIDDEYGLEIPQLHIVNISLPAEVEKAVDARSSMAIIGDLAQYQAFQIASATPDAAKNPAGGIAGAGMGLGMGMAMAGPMLGGLAPGPQSAPPMPTPPPMRMWHVAQSGEPTGPFSETQMIDAIRAGGFRRENRVWSAGRASWIEAAQVPALLEHFPAQPPPLP